MKAGKLRHRVTLQNKIVTKDPSYGSVVESWNDTVTVWASFSVMKGNEDSKEQLEKSVVLAQIVMRYREGVDSTLRAVYNGQVFEILSVVDTDERHAELVLTCRKWS